MIAMSSLVRLHAGRRFIPALVGAIVFAATGLAFAGAASLQDLAGAKLMPSGVPQLLGSITQAGRKGWECMPERGAAAKGSSAADLPADGASP